MEGNKRWVALTAVAPVAWGANYFVTHAFLPADHPLYGAALRALPAGLVLLALCRRRPRGAWWGRSAVLGLLNVSVFFVLVFAASQLLPTSVASTVMAVSPLAMMLAAWLLMAERPGSAHLAGAAIGLGGVCLMLLGGEDGISVPGVLVSAAAVLVSSFGHILAKRWNTGPGTGTGTGMTGTAEAAGAGVLASTAWQLTAGGLLLLPVAVAVEGAPPPVSPSALLAFCYVALVATALAFSVWFAGLRRLPAGTVGLIGLLNPVTGVLLGTTVAGEVLTGRQLGGLALVLAGVALGRPTAGTRPERRLPAGTPAAPGPHPGLRSGPGPSRST
ncbi:EamA family transporter [Streptomyces erythrochromogenes]|uniref:EamA family transporter n=1 Tax=Streptomyces erythrochromogenes TaxID=285574 RepID=UPI00224CF9E8|nr:EamA family transporter [Streptomyces erythrochromogenes]MCX5589226.1 EamA family transporter [Streptomyces erythrochromogenes]